MSRPPENGDGSGAGANTALLLAAADASVASVARQTGRLDALVAHVTAPEPAAEP
ncbi:hypothetical protein [Streptomyces sp. NPDC051636]|uniref:hypothetical protein n=1 Tax=Streptomyces sp. NPDC051636 TaxID=3365663 RepID=UPI0037B60F40